MNILATERLLLPAALMGFYTPFGHFHIIDKLFYAINVRCRAKEKKIPKLKYSLGQAEQAAGGDHPR